MNINIYSEYKVRIHTKGSEIVAYDEFREFENTEIVIIDGGRLLEKLKKILENNWLSSLDIDSKKQTIKVETFNPMTGEGEDTTYEIKEITEVEE